ncbi:MAG: hypothetical protein JO325_05085 [Solirubrobacterales bacterium]|nr:hypothetical protein [Solirubrobacterales bacterium]
MKRSTDRILTTHAGSLPYPDDNPPGNDDELRTAVADVVALQHELGIDLVNEGEYTKGGDWLSFADDRFAGFEITDASGEKPLIAQGKDREEFDAFYRYATERGTLFYTAGGQVSPRRMRWVCTDVISYAGHEQLRREIEILRACDPREDAFLTSTAPASLEVYRGNAYYHDDVEYLYALADALRVEYELIVDAGFVLQVDDAWLPALWDRIGIEMGLEAFRERCRVRVQALNHALANIPEDRIRYHMCWGSWHGPHAHDLELVHLVDILLEVRAQAYLIEGANAATSTSGRCGGTCDCPRERSSCRASSRTRRTSSSTPTWSRSGSNGSRRSSAPRTSSPGPTAASVGARIPRSPGRSCGRSRRARREHPRAWDNRLNRKSTTHP